MLNDTAAAIQEGFAGRPQQRPMREQVPVAQRIRRPAGVITNHHIRDLLRDLVPDLEEEHDTIVRTINRVTLAVCRDLALAGDEQATRTWRNVTTEQRTNMADESFAVILEDHPQLHFMQNCVQHWPILGLIQSKWTQMSSHRRRRAPMAQPEKGHDQDEGHNADR